MNAFPKLSAWFKAFPFVTGLACLLTGCSTIPLTLDAVGPKPAKGLSLRGQGSLLVYTATEAKRTDKMMPYYVHSSYTVNAKDGHRVKWVENHSGDMDQAPHLVALPAGEYLIRAASEDYGMLSVPVVIGATRITEVYLDGTWNRHQHEIASTNLVRLPNGHIVGWKAEASR